MVGKEIVGLGLLGVKETLLFELGHLLLSEGSALMHYLDPFSRHFLACYFIDDEIELVPV